MKKAKNKTPGVAAPVMTPSVKTWKEASSDYASMAKDLMDAFLTKGFTTDQSFQLTTLFISRAKIVEA